MMLFEKIWATLPYMLLEDGTWRILTGVFLESQVLIEVLVLE